MLTDEQRKELEEHGPKYIQAKLSHPHWGAGPGAAIGGFRCGDITRSDIDDWLVEQNKIEARRERVKRWAGIISLVIGALGLVLAAWQIWK